MHPFQIENLDHVAIKVKDMELSIDWYRRVLGLKEYKLEKWGDYPVFMLSGMTGVAIFPANLDDPELDPNSDHVKIDHFAFNVSNEAFQQAVEHYKATGIPYTYSDHHYYDSIYTKDPDGHTVELTTLKIDFTENT